MPTKKEAWKNNQVASDFLGIRESIPFGKEQVQVMVHMIQQMPHPPQSILDLGCGDGFTGAFLLSLYPEAAGDFVDYSPPMLEKAKERLKNVPHTRVMEANLENTPLPRIVGTTSYDCIVSSYALHHLTHPRKKSIYQEIYNLLNPGGIFINVEHVASSTPEVSHIWDELFIDHIFSYKKDHESEISRETVSNDYLTRPDQYDNILEPVEDQCQWLREIGFQHADIYFKYFEMAVFGGYRKG
ncbi:MAG TPA: class I SAM-dependent methyltransferase [Paenibacillaceae bacterium]|nr:class I SAM-dependent methyltransferase [Paenibacillaceae bacterium]